MNTTIKHIPVILFSLIVFLALTALPAMAMNETLIGGVVKTDAGAALSTDSGEYMVLGQDITPFIGETVVVTGNVDVGVLSKTIQGKTVKKLDAKDIVDPSVTASGKKAA